MKTGRLLPDKVTMQISVLSIKASYKQNAPNSLPFIILFCFAVFQFSTWIIELMFFNGFLKYHIDIEYIATYAPGFHKHQVGWASPQPPKNAYYW